MAESIHCAHCGTAIEVPEAVLAQGLAALAEFDAACAGKCRQVAALEAERQVLVRQSRWQREHLYVTGYPGCPELIEASPEQVEQRIQELKAWAGRNSSLLDEIVELEAGMGHRLSSVERQRCFDKQCGYCRIGLQIPDEVAVKGEEAIQEFIDACSGDCRRAAEIEWRKESRAAADVALATMVQGDTTGEYGRQAMDTFRAQEEEIRKEDEELAVLRARMAHVPYRYRMAVPVVQSEVEKTEGSQTASEALRFLLKWVLLGALLVIVLKLLETHF